MDWTVGKIIFYKHMFQYDIFIILISRKLKLYEEQELTMQVFSEPEGGLGTERRGSGVSVGMGDTSQDNTYATIQRPLPTSRHRPTTPDYTTLPGNHNVWRKIIKYIHIK